MESDSDVAICYNFIWIYILLLCNNKPDKPDMWTTIIIYFTWDSHETWQNVIASVKMIHFFLKPPSCSYSFDHCSWKHPVCCFCYKPANVCIIIIAEPLQRLMSECVFVLHAVFAFIDLLFWKSLYFLVSFKILSWFIFFD